MGRRLPPKGVCTRATIIDEVEAVMRMRPYLPWYERYGADFLDVMFRYPFEQREPPEERESWAQRRAADDRHTLAIQTQLSAACQNCGSTIRLGNECPFCVCGIFAKRGEIVNESEYHESD
jgi:hypothetical protein